MCLFYFTALKAKLHKRMREYQNSCGALKVFVNKI